MAVGAAKTDAPSAVLLVHNGLHLEVQIDRQSAIGKDDPAGVDDILIEAALTTIQDCEDSVAAVDAEDKTGVYRNWLGLMRGDLLCPFRQGRPDRDPHPGSDDRRLRRTGRKSELVLRGRSLMLVRNVGHHMTTDMVRYCRCAGV